MVVSLNPHPTPLFLLRIDLRVSLGTLMETVLVDRLAVVVSSLPCIASSQDPPQADGLFLISQRIPTLPAPPPPPFHFSKLGSTYGREYAIFVFPSTAYSMRCNFSSSTHFSASFIF